MRVPLAAVDALDSANGYIPDLLERIRPTHYYRYGDGQYTEYSYRLAELFGVAWSNFSPSVLVLRQDNFTRRFDTMCVTALRQVAGRG